MADMSPRKTMASGGAIPSGDFGVGPMFGADRHIAGEKPNGKTLGVNDRACGAPVKHTLSKHPSQANPDHGPHR